MASNLPIIKKKIILGLIFLLLINRELFSVQNPPPEIVKMFLPNSYTTGKAIFIKIHIMDTKGLENISDVQLRFENKLGQQSFSQMHYVRTIDPTNHIFEFSGMIPSKYVIVGIFEYYVVVNPKIESKRFHSAIKHVYVNKEPYVQKSNVPEKEKTSVADKSAIATFSGLLALTGIVLYVASEYGTDEEKNKKYQQISALCLLGSIIFVGLSGSSKISVNLGFNRRFNSNGFMLNVFYNF